MNCEQTAKPLHPLDRSMCISSPFRNASMKKAPKNHRSQVLFFMPPTGVEPVLCLQKGILSPSCLPISPQWLLNELLLTILRAAAHIIQ